jgi:SAM-dependent methyltransferase
MMTGFFQIHLANVMELRDQHLPSHYMDEGEIRLKGTERWFPIVRGIPRFLSDPDANYTANFGFQWKKFSRTQLDSFTGLTLSRDRLFNDTDWKAEDLKGKRVLEVGCGSGRFTEILLSTGAIVYSFDYSAAVEANAANHAEHSNLFLFQGSVYELPFPDNYFDYIFCFGVLQHTPDPMLSLQCMFSKLRQGGNLSVDNYPTSNEVEMRRYPNARYREVRKHTSNWKPQNLFNFVRTYLLFWFPIDFIIRTRLPKKWSDQILYHLNIPCFNYVHTISMPYAMLREWAILDTFDALSAKFDFPVTKEQFEDMGATLGGNQMVVKRAFNGYVLNLTK